ncbi:inducible alternative oxidase 2 [Microbotryomycetes sp. JL201]|nr:inducible alternative oxidase 2 [Microbotryomycetes sp. JL201]
MSIRLATLASRHPPRLLGARLLTSSSLLSAQASDARNAFQPHHLDAKTATWKHSRPHEDWVMRHAVYTPEDTQTVKVVRAPLNTPSDKLAAGLVKLSRRLFDFVTRYKHASPEAAIEALKKQGKTDLSLAELRKEGFLMTPDQWNVRILFLESIAGVPGFTAGVLRHLRSIRALKRDGGWIATLLQEAENERMHLLTWLKIAKPGLFMRVMIILAQGVFFNAFFLTYLMSPRAAHRFVGCLEEEACLTYTQILDEMRRGHLPEWDKLEVPQIAKDYWRMPQTATMTELVEAIRADEAGHRFVNHTLANLRKDDVNPFAIKHPDPLLQGTVPGFDRERSLKWAKEAEQEIRNQLERDHDQKKSQ